MQEGADEPALAVHTKIARGPDGRFSDVAGDDGILAGYFADHSGHGLRVNRPTPRRCDRQRVELRARFLVMCESRLQVFTVTLLLELLQQTRERFSHVPDDPQIKPAPVAQVFAADIHLSNAGFFWIKLPVREIC